MDREYFPDRWLLIKLPDDNGYKVLGAWIGGYMHGDAWRLNSGVTKVEETEEFYYFYGHSGSVYKCLKQAEGFANIMSAVLPRLKEMGAEVVEDLDSAISRCSVGGNKREGNK